MTLESDAASAARALDAMAARVAADIRNGSVIELPLDEIAEIARKALPHLPGVSPHEARRGLAADLTRSVSTLLGDERDDDPIVEHRFWVFVDALGAAFPAVLH